MEKKIKIYISGQITGLSPEAYTANFAQAEEALSAKGFEVVNPVTLFVDPESIDPKKNTPAEIYRAHLRADLAELVTCEAIYMLPNWQSSEGATLEREVAKQLGLYIHYEEQPQHRDIVKAIQAAMGVAFKLIAQDSRNRWHVYARMIYAHHCKCDGDSIQEIARQTQHDNSSITYYLRKYNDEYKYNADFRKAAEKVATLLSRKLNRGL